MNDYEKRARYIESPSYRQRSLFKGLLGAIVAFVIWVAVFVAILLQG